MVMGKGYHVWLPLHDPNKGEIRVRFQLGGGGATAESPSAPTPAMQPAPLPAKPFVAPIKNISESISSVPIIRSVPNSSSKVLQQAHDLEQSIISQCKAKNGPYEDPEFGAVDSSLYKHPPGQHSKLINWKRPSEIAPNPQLFVDGVESGDVIQGALGDCYFLGAISGNYQ